MKVVISPWLAKNFSALVICFSFMKKNFPYLNISLFTIARPR